MKARKTCWTCRARKTQCDGQLPMCRACVRDHQTCRGYELRLSWPKENDRKRAMVGSSIAAGMLELPPPDQARNHRFFINTTWQDMQLYSRLVLRTHLGAPGPSSGLSPQRLRVSHLELIRHFYNSAYTSLVTLGMLSLQLRDALISLSMVHDTSPGLALLSSLMAFSSLHRNGFDEQAVQFKISAIHFLSASLKEGPLTGNKAIQHVAASMLLGAFEIFIPSENSGEWVWYVWGAMDMIQATHLKDPSYESNTETGCVLDWVYYHDALAHFAVRHWRHESLVLKGAGGARPGLQNLQNPHLTRYRPAAIAPNPTYAVLNLLSEICTTVLDPWDPRSHDQAYHERLKGLEGRIDNLTLKPLAAKHESEPAFALGLYQLAIRVYLVRATQSIWEAPRTLDATIEAAFAEPVSSCSCEHFFPLLILAGEARTEPQRLVILGLIDRVEHDDRRRSIGVVRNAVRSIWVQQDLHADADVLVNYVGMISAAISSSNTVPSFV